jgi:hypothetical protein
VQWKLIVVGVVLGAACVGVFVKGINDAQVRKSAAPAVTAAAARPTPIESIDRPVSEACTEMAKLMESKGFIRPGGITRGEVTLLTDARWTALDVAAQASTASCLSRYMAGSEDRQIKKLVFRNQLSGVVYGVLEYDRYRVGE